MAVFRVQKTQNYTIMSNHHLRNKTLSLKATMRTSSTTSMRVVRWTVMTCCSMPMLLMRP